MPTRPLAHVLTVALLATACHADPSSADGSDSATLDDTGQSTPTDDPWFCDDGSYTFSEGLVETEHYRFTSELEEDEALSMAQLAEAAYQAFAAYFGAEPPDLPLSVGWYATAASWEAAMAADGISAPEAGGYYWPGSQTAYMYTQPTIYFSRMLFLHELAHQFHYLARTGNSDRNAWYVEGLAEYLSRHDWDGRCVRLGRLPMLTWEDYPAQALAEGVVDFDGTNDLSRPWAWATFRYLQTVETTDFDAFRDDYDADASALLADHLDVDAAVAGMEAWLPEAQEPLTPIFLDWIHIAPGEVEGEALYSSFAVAKQEEAFSAAHEAPVTGDAGIVAGYEDASNYSLWLVNTTGAVWTFVSTDGSAIWWPMGDVPLADRYEWSLDGTVVTLNGQAFEETNGFPPRGGLALYGDALIFEDIAL